MATKKTGSDQYSKQTTTYVNAPRKVTSWNLTTPKGATPPSKAPTKQKSIKPSAGGSSAPQAGASALPPKKPIPAPVTWMPFIDQRRTNPTDTNKSNLATTSIPPWMTSVLQRGLKDDFGLKPGENLQLGDFFPNVQEALKPVFNSEQYEKEQGPTDSAASQWASAQETFKAAQERSKSDADVMDIVPSVVKAGLQGAGAAITGVGEWLKSSDDPTVKSFGGGVSGLPMAIMNTMNMSSQLSEQIVGSAEQMAGVGIDPMAPVGRFIARVASAGAEIARSVGAPEIAAELEKHSNAPPSIIENLVANVVARQRAAGQDSTVAEQMLNSLIQADKAQMYGSEGGLVQATLNGIQPMSEEAEALISRQGELIKTAEQLGENGEELSSDAWKAAMYTWEGTQFVQEAQQRLAAGEDYDTVYSDLEGKMTAVTRGQDIAGQLLVDPLNLLDAVGGIPKILGLGSRSERWAVSAGAEFLQATPEGMGMVKLLERGGDVRSAGGLMQGLRKIPGVGAVLKPLPETLFNRRFEEMVTTMKMVVQGISPEAGTRLLNAGIDMHPKALAFEAFLKNGADDVIRNADGVPFSSAQVQELLGMSGHVATQAEMDALRLAPGSQIDIWNSNAADRARDLWLKMGDDSSDVAKLADDFENVQKVFNDAFQEQAITVQRKTTNALGQEVVEDVVIKGEDAISMAEKKMSDWLEGLKTSTMKAAGYEAPTGLYKKITQVRTGMQKIQGVFAFFQIKTNWGNPIRNWATNTTTGFLDGINMLSSMRGTEDEIGRLGLAGVPGLGRSFGGQLGFDAGKAAEPLGGVRGLFEKIKPMSLSQRAETGAGKRVVIQTFQRHMAATWKVGKNIPEKEWAQVAQVWGERAPEIKALLENCRTLDDLNAVVARAASDDPWRAAAHAALSGTHDEALLADLDDIAKVATDQADFEMKVQDYVYKNRDHFNEFIRRGVVMDGTPAADALKAAQLATEGIPPKRRAEILDQFSKKLVRQDASFSLYKQYTEQAINQLQGFSPKDIAKAGLTPPPGVTGTFNEWLLKRRGAAVEGMDNAMREIRPTMYEFFDARDSGDWGRIRELGEKWSLDQTAKKGIPEEVTDEAGDWVFPHPEGVANPFAGVVDKKTAADAYNTWTDEYWSGTRAGLFTEFADIHKTASDAIVALGKPRPNGVPVDMVEDFLPLSRAEQRMYGAQLQQIAISRGVVVEEGKTITEAIRDVLQQEGVLHPNRIFRSNIQDKYWVKQARDALERYSGKEGAYAQAAAEAAGMAGKAPMSTADEVAADIMRGLSEEPIDSRMADQVAGEAANMAERDAAIQKVLDTARNAPQKPPMDQKAIDDLKEFVKSIEPRMTETRVVGEQIATKARDFALLDYGDKSGFDLMAGFMYNYPKWYMGTIKNMMVRAMDNPGRIAALLKMRGEIRRMNRDLPEWWQDQLSLTVNGNPFFFNLLATIDPLNGFLGDKFRDPDLYNGDPLSEMMAEAQQFGPGLHGLWASAMAARSFFKGDREAGMGWVGNLGPATRGITAITALAKEHIPGMDFIPAGGVVLEPWLWNSEGNERQMVGTKYDARRVGLELGRMVDLYEKNPNDPNGVSPEQAYDAMLSGRGEVYERALQASKVKSAGSVLASWLAGSGVKYRDGIEIEVQRMDADRVALMQSKADGYYDGRPEAYRAAWEEMRENYPWMDFVQGFRRDDMGRMNIYAMSVYDRMPPNNKAYITALMGGEAEIYNDMLDKFYGSEPGQKPCDINNLTVPEQEMFMSMMKMMGATLSLPGDATSKEWNMARQARSAMYDGLNRQYKNIVAIQDQYFTLLNSQEPNAYQGAEAYLAQHGELQAYWDDKDAAIAQDPILAKYWGSMELFERVSKDEFEIAEAKKYPGLANQVDEYYRIKDTDPVAAKQYLKDHPNITDYWDDKDDWTLGLDKELVGMTTGISNLEGQWGSLRTDTQPEMAGQQRVVDLIESGSRPMGSFELPEDMSARQTQAGIENELDAFTQNGGNWGSLYGQLKAMGNLDDTLIAYQEFARGKSGTETAMNNLPEIKALLVALATINEGAGGGTGGVGGYSGGGYASGSGGGGGGQYNATSTGKARRISAKRYGGASKAPKAQTQAQDTQQYAQMDTFMAQVQESAPMYAGYMRNIADMDEASIASFLEANPAFRDWLLKTGYTVATLKAYFTRLNAARAAVAPKAKKKRA